MVSDKRETTTTAVLVFLCVIFAGITASLSTALLVIILSILLLGYLDRGDFLRFYREDRKDLLDSHSSLRTKALEALDIAEDCLKFGKKEHRRWLEASTISQKLLRSAVREKILLLKRLQELWVLLHEAYVSDGQQEWQRVWESELFINIGHADPPDKK